MKRMKKRLNLFVIGAFIAFATLALDQFTKNWIMHQQVQPPASVLHIFKNTGIALSIPLPTIIIIPLILILIIAAAYYLHREHKHQKINLHHPVIIVALALISGGALGNIIDRLRFGYVVDFIAIWKFPVFNLADAAITCGIAMLAVWYGVLEK